MSDVKIVKLATGEELISTVSEHSTDTYLLEDTFSVAMTAEQRLLFVPFMQYSNAMKSFEINKRFVMFLAEPAEVLAADYKQATGRLITPSKSIVGVR